MISFICPVILGLMSEVFEFVSEISDGRLHGIDQKNRLTILEWKIRKIPTLKCDSDLPEVIREDAATLELFQLTMLVYLRRALGSSLRNSEDVRSSIDRAFTIFSRLRTLQRQFPLFILGSEARTDEDRMVVLDLISRSEEDTSVRSLRSMKRVIQSLWAQDDLAEQELDYLKTSYARVLF